MKRATLAATGTTPDFEWDFAYDLPSDCLRVVEIYPGDIDFTVENSQILSDEDGIDVNYIFRNDDPSSWDSCFAEALAWKLAHLISYALTQSASLVGICEKSYEKKLSEARSMDGAEGVLKGLEADFWLKARL